MEKKSFGTELIKESDMRMARKQIETFFEKGYAELKCIPMFLVGEGHMVMFDYGTTFPAALVTMMQRKDNVLKLMRILMNWTSSQCMKLLKVGNDKQKQKATEYLTTIMEFNEFLTEHLFPMIERREIKCKELYGHLQAILYFQKEREQFGLKIVSWKSSEMMLRWFKHINSKSKIAAVELLSVDYNNFKKQSIKNGSLVNTNNRKSYGRGRGRNRMRRGRGYGKILSED